MVLVTENMPIKHVAPNDIIVYVPIEKFEENIDIYGDLTSISTEKLPIELSFDIDNYDNPSLENGKYYFRAKYVCGLTEDAGKICQANTFFAGLFKSEKHNKNYMNNYLVKGIIPKGTDYYTGNLLYGNNGEIGIFPSKIIITSEKIDN